MTQIPDAVATLGVHRVVARQPIVAKDDHLVAFRMIFRQTAPTPTAIGPYGPTFTAEVMADEAAFDIGALVGDKQLYCRPWPEVLAGAVPVTLPPRRSMLEVGHDLLVGAHTLDDARRLAGGGYPVALELRDWRPELASLVDVASVVRLDLAVLSRDRAAVLVDAVAPYDVTLMASGCQTADDLGWAGQSGFELFSGPAVQRPVEPDGALAPSALGQVQLAAELLDERVDFGRVEQILNHEPALVVQVLHEASLGAGGGLRREVHSIREALVVMGTMRLRQWAAMAVLGRNVATPRTDALTVALTRARLCALLAKPRGLDAGYAFTAGLLSALDRLLGVPILVVEHRIDVDKELAAAAFHREGRVGALVGLAARYQDAVEADLPGPDITDIDLMAAGAFAWAMSNISAIERASALD